MRVAVEVQRIEYRTHTFVVRADTVDEAVEHVLDIEVPNFDFNDASVDCGTEQCVGTRVLEEGEED